MDDTLGLGYILPTTTGRIRDLHSLERATAGRTIKIPSANSLTDGRKLMFND